MASLSVTLRMPPAQTDEFQADEAGHGITGYPKSHSYSHRIDHLLQTAYL